MASPLVLLSLALFVCATSNAVNASLHKIHASLRRRSLSSNFVSKDAFVSFREGNTNGLQGPETFFATREERLVRITESLIMNAKRTQADFFSHLNQQPRRLTASASFTTKSFWISNQVLLRNAPLELLEEMAKLPEVASIDPPQTILLDNPEPTNTPAKPSNTLEWGLEKIQVSKAWERFAAKGEGIIVANIDTGVRVSHEALAGNFVGEYGWFDPYENTTTPTDGNGHGTHTMGTIAGSHGIGVAPGTKWMACRGCFERGCSQEALLGCAEFMTCPTDVEGNNPDCTKAPHIINNSWGGRQGSLWYQDVVKAWLAVGIVPVFANGNAGAECTTVNSPGDMPDIVIAVGSTTVADKLSTFSSRGPSVNGVMKPHVSAPGSDVRSAWIRSDDDYVSISGTSMATPHVVGVIALMMHVEPQITYERISHLISQAVDTEPLVLTGQTCGGIPETTYPNNLYGYGRINAAKAMDLVSPPKPDCFFNWKKFCCYPRDDCKWGWREVKCVPN